MSGHTALYFQLDKEHRPKKVAGVPPDAFSADGQLWGNPLYDWEQLEKEDYSWWRERMKAASMLFDCVRIDHFIGICRYFSVPAEDTTAKNGTYYPGPGMKLIHAIPGISRKCRSYRRRSGRACAGSGGASGGIGVSGHEGACNSHLMVEKTTTIFPICIGAIWWPTQGPTITIRW